RSAHYESAGAVLVDVERERHARRLARQALQACPARHHSCVAQMGGARQARSGERQRAGAVPGAGWIEPVVDAVLLAEAVAVKSTASQSTTTEVTETNTCETEITVKTFCLFTVSSVCVRVLRGSAFVQCAWCSFSIAWLMNASISCAGRAPAVRATSRPCANTASVGIDRIPNRSPRSGSASVFTFTTRTRPAWWAATF